MSTLCTQCRSRQERIDWMRQEIDTLERLVAECARKNAEFTSQVGNTRNKSTHSTDPSPANRTEGEVAR